MNIEEIQPLLEKYQGRGPRYTSYPSAASFSDAFSDVSYREYAQASNQHPLPAPLSLYIHIPFCRSLCYYCACNKVVTHSADAGQQYLDYLYKEMTMHAELYAADRCVEQLHLGGGTPTFLRPDQLEELLQTVAQCFHLGLPKQLELAIEIDPRTVSVDDVTRLANMGFNRFSLGIQDTNPEVQRAINREQSMGHIAAIVKALRACQVSSIAMDLLLSMI
ncbi:radical SAM protein, partial [bacterium]|nr:radical SAM protein [bacterium]